MTDGEIIEKRLKSEDKEELLKLELTRDRDGLRLFIRVHRDIEETIKKASETEVKKCKEDGLNVQLMNVSSSWSNGNPKRFYYRIRAGGMGEYFARKYDDYGTGFFKSNMDGTYSPNLAVLRTVAISKGHYFNVSENYSDETLKEVAKKFYIEVSNFYKAFIKPVKIDASLKVSEVV